MKRELRRAAALAVLTMGAMAPAAHAQAPTPCNGLIKDDPQGDNTTYLLGNDTSIPSEANGDMLGVFINRTEAKTTFNLQLLEVNKTIPAGAESLVYRIFYTSGGTSRYLETGVGLTGGDPYFEYGTFETTFTKEGDATGMWHEGANGVISIDIPAEAGGTAKWTETYMWPGYGRGAILTPTDYIPDGGEGGSRISWNGNPCPTGAGLTPPPPMTAPTPGAPQNPQPGRPAVAQGPLKVTVRPTSLKAKKVKKARKLALKLETKEQLTNVVVTLKKGAKKLGTGKLASLTNISKLNLKLKKKGLKKGAYALQITAKRADGSTGAVTLKLRVK